MTITTFKRNSILCDRRLVQSQQMIVMMITIIIMMLVMLMMMIMVTMIQGQQLPKVGRSQKVVKICSHSPWPTSPLTCPHQILTREFILLIEQCQTLCRTMWEPPLCRTTTSTNQTISGFLGDEPSPDGQRSPLVGKKVAKSALVFKTFHFAQPQLIAFHCKFNEK